MAKLVPRGWTKQKIEGKWFIDQDGNPAKVIPGVWSSETLPENQWLYTNGVDWFVCASEFDSPNDAVESACRGAWICRYALITGSPDRTLSEVAYGTHFHLPASFTKWLSVADSAERLVALLHRAERIQDAISGTKVEPNSPKKTYVAFGAMPEDWTKGRPTDGCSVSPTGMVYQEYDASRPTIAHAYPTMRRWWRVSGARYVMSNQEGDVHEMIVTLVRLAFNHRISLTDSKSYDNRSFTHFSEGDKHWYVPGALIDDVLRHDSARAAIEAIGARLKQLGAPAPPPETTSPAEAPAPQPESPFGLLTDVPAHAIVMEDTTTHNVGYAVGGCVDDRGHPLPRTLIRTAYGDIVIGQTNGSTTASLKDVLLATIARRNLPVGLWACHMSGNTEKALRTYAHRAGLDSAIAELMVPPEAPAPVFCADDLGPTARRADSIEGKLHDIPDCAIVVTRDTDVQLTEGGYVLEANEGRTTILLRSPFGDVIVHEGHAALDCTLRLVLEGCLGVPMESAQWLVDSLGVHQRLAAATDPIRNWVMQAKPSTWKRMQAFEEKHGRAALVQELLIERTRIQMAQEDEGHMATLKNEQAAVDHGTQAGSAATADAAGTAATIEDFAGAAFGARAQKPKRTVKDKAKAAAKKAGKDALDDAKEALFRGTVRNTVKEVHGTAVTIAKGVGGNSDTAMMLVALLETERGKAALAATFGAMLGFGVDMLEGEHPALERLARELKVENGSVLLDPVIGAVLAPLAQMFVRVCMMAGDESAADQVAKLSAPLQLVAAGGTLLNEDVRVEAKVK